MDNPDQEQNNKQPFFQSTYASLTAQSILENYKIFLKLHEIERAISGPNNFYHRLIQVSLKNIINSRIIDQIRSSQAYIQKIYVDYQISAPEMEEGAPGWVPHLELKDEQQHLISLGQKLQEEETTHRNLIAKAQRSLSKIVEDFNNLLHKESKNITSLTHGDEQSIILESMTKVINYLLSKDTQALNHENTWKHVNAILGQPLKENEKEILKQKLHEVEPFFNNATNIFNEHLHNTSSQKDVLLETKVEFRDLMHDILKTINKLPNPLHQILHAQATENRDSLYFDPN